MAQNKALTKIFDGLAKVLADVIETGVPMRDEDGTITVAPAPAAFLSVARQFLKDNNYQAEVEKNPDLKRMASNLPFAGAEELQASGKDDYLIN